MIGIVAAAVPSVSKIVLRHTPEARRDDVTDILAMAGAVAALTAGISAKVTDPTVYTPDGLPGKDKPQSDSTPDM